MERLTLAHDLVLLSLDPETGVRRRRQQMGYAILGALLAELALADRIELDDKRVAVLSAAPTGRPAADELLRRIGETKAHKPTWWISRSQREFTERVLDELVEHEVVTRGEGRMLGFIPHATYRQVDGRRLADLRNDVEGIAVEGLVPTSARMVALANLIVAAELDRYVFPGQKRGDLRRRLGRLDGAGWASKGVRKSLEAMRGATAG